MPMIDGKVVRARYTKLDLAELSSVDDPAQPGALATIMKRNVSPAVPQASLMAVAVAKYVCEDDGAHTFQEVLQANEFDEKIWPMTSALSQAIRSIMGDTAIKPADRETKVTQSVDEFLASVRDLSPGAEKRLAAIISKKDSTTMKTIEQLTAEVDALTGKCTALTGEVETLKGKLSAADQAKLDAEADKDKACKALAEATDEVIKVDGNDVRKSAVGEASFSVFKSLNDRAITAEVEKRVESEFPHVVGTTTEKALVVKALQSMSEDAQKALTAIMTSAEKMAAGGFERLGAGDENHPNVLKAKGDFEAKVSDIQKRDNVERHVAMTKARREFPAEFEAFQASGQAA